MSDIKIRVNKINCIRQNYQLLHSNLKQMIKSKININDLNSNFIEKLINIFISEIINILSNQLELIYLINQKNQNSISELFSKNNKTLIPLIINFFQKLFFLITSNNKNNEYTTKQKSSLSIKKRYPKQMIINLNEFKKDKKNNFIKKLKINLSHERKSYISNRIIYNSNNFPKIKNETNKDLNFTIVYSPKLNLKNNYNKKIRINKSNIENSKYDTLRKIRNNSRSNSCDFTQNNFLENKNKIYFIPKNINLNNLKSKLSNSYDNLNINKKNKNNSKKVSYKDICNYFNKDFKINKELLENSKIKK